MCRHQSLSPKWSIFFQYFYVYFIMFTSQWERERGSDVTKNLDGLNVREVVMVDPDYVHISI